MENIDKDWWTLREAAQETGKALRGIQYHYNQALADPVGEKRFNYSMRFGRVVLETETFLPYLRNVTTTPLKCDGEV